MPFIRLCVLPTAALRLFDGARSGSFEPVFGIAGNAPAHCIPGVLRWLDRADIAGLNAPRPIAIHYGARDIPVPENHSAAYNDTVPVSVSELRAIYAAAGAPGAVELIVSPDLAHEIDMPLITAWLRRQSNPAAAGASHR